ncbi:baseplate J/gp47 family protein [Fusobacterium varium]|uniref:baseplate J/gp47 family protein n=1 Tax=Fusobacterium varium TaxID=856 RepID=UPI0022E54131|nr:baseplate J/gp47 family protein [Fusobacterium varium]
MSNYTARDVDAILKNILDDIPDEYLKDVGTFTHDLSKAYALESHKHEKIIQELWEFFDIAKLTGKALEDRVFQLKGLKRKQATCALGEIVVTGNGTIKEGDLFETPYAIQFKAAETVEIENIGVVKIQAVAAGANGNVGTGAITLMPVTIQGIKEVKNISPTYDGFNAETDSSLLERYYIAVQTPATSGNIYHYKQWAREVEGVGNSKIFPLWDGANTVKIVIINDNKLPASSELVKKVQDYIDPMGENNETWGCGAGEAPIGAYCTVISAKGKNINIDVTLLKETGTNLDDIKESIKKNITTFLQDIAFNKDYVSYSLLSNAILEANGVIEWTKLSINGGTNNIFLEAEEVAILKDVNINE